MFCSRPTHLPGSAHTKVIRTLRAYVYPDDIISPQTKPSGFNVPGKPHEVVLSTLLENMHRACNKLVYICTKCHEPIGFSQVSETFVAHHVC